MNLFAQQIKFEDTEGLNLPEGQLITEGDEGESVAAAVAEVTEEEAGIAEDERAMDGLVEDEETLSDVQEVVEDDAPKMEHTGLTPVGARLAKIVLARVVGQRHANKTLPKMEHFNSRSDARDATSFVQEGVRDALKSFWEALKAQFKKIWAKVKTWYIKTFSAAKSLHDRAKTIRDRAEGSSSTIDKKTFAFAQAKQLVINGRLKTAEEFGRALDQVNAMVATATDAPTDKALDNLADNLDQIASDNKGDAETIVSTIIDGAFENMKKMLASGKNLADNKVLESLGGGASGDAEASSSDVLPGDKLFVVVMAKNIASDPVKALRMARTAFVNTKDKPRDVSSTDVVTLNTSQIAKFCDVIASSAGDIVEYERKWQNNDRSQEKVLKAIDDAVRDGAQDYKDSDSDTAGKDERALRTMASAATQFVKRAGGQVSQITGYALPVYAATLNWCEGSMRNYKK